MRRKKKKEKRKKKKEKEKEKEKKEKKIPTSILHNKQYQRYYLMEAPLKF